jgi:hypothetical protein
MSSGPCCPQLLTCASDRACCWCAVHEQKPQCAANSEGGARHHQEGAQCAGASVLVVCLGATGAAAVAMQPTDLQDPDFLLVTTDTSVAALVCMALLHPQTVRHRYGGSRCGLLRIALPQYMGMGRETGGLWKQRARRRWRHRGPHVGLLTARAAI